MARYKALDALRGLTIATMILVNTPGSWSHVYGPLLHADWHGCTPTDLVFPFFMFIIGSAMFFSFQKTTDASRLQQQLRVIKRGTIIFLIGLGLNYYPFTKDIEQLRILGVLQRIGLAYIVAASIALAFKQRGIWLVSAAILLGYWFLLSLAGSDAYSLENNIVRQIDLAVLTEDHLWRGKGIAFDPEGLLSTLPAAVSVLFGYELTRFLTTIKDKSASIGKVSFVGIFAICIGLIWSIWMPINKPLWTSSYVLYASGIACLVLAFFIWLCDVKENQLIVNPLVVYGTNPLFVFVLSGLIVKTYYMISVDDIPISRWMFLQLDAFLPSKLASLSYAVAHVVLLWVVSLQLYKRKIFIKI